MMMIIISIVIPTIVLHQALRCGYLPDTCFVFCSFSQFTAFLSIVKKGGLEGWNIHIYSHTLRKGPAGIPLKIWQQSPQWPLPPEVFGNYPCVAF